MTDDVRESKRQRCDPIIFMAAIELLNFYHWPTQLSGLIYTHFTVNYRDAFDRLHVRLNIILFIIMITKIIAY